MKSSKLSLIIIVILAIVVGVLSYSYLSSSKTDIYLFDGNYSAGTPITQDILTVTQIDTDLVLEAFARGEGQYITSENIEEVLETHLKTDVLAGMPLMSLYSDEIGGSGAEIRLAEDMVAVTIEADNLTAGSPDIENGSMVNIYASFEGQNTQETKLLYQNVKVIDVLYSEIYNEASETPTVAGVILELEPEESIVVEHAIEFGSIRLGLVKAGAYEEKDIDSHRTTNLSSMNEEQAGD